MIYTNDDGTEIIMTCTCGSDDHRFSIGSYDAELDSYVMSIRWMPERSLLRRIKRAILYVFTGRSGTWHQFDEILLDRSDLRFLSTTFGRWAAKPEPEPVVSVNDIQRFLNAMNDMGNLMGGREKKR
jgi:hypothetical protein